MQIASRASDGFTIFDITGDIDLAHSPQMRKALLGEIKEKRIPKVYLNMKNVRYIDSSGIASLVEGLKASRDAGTRLKIVVYGKRKLGTNRAVTAAGLNIKGMITAINLVETIEEVPTQADHHG